MLATAFAIGATSFLASFLATEIIRRLANRHGWIVAPRPDRWHQRPTAMHGGLGFGVVFILAAAGILMRHVAGLRLVGIGALPKEVILGGALIAGAIVIFVFGLFDDLKGFRPATKVLCEVVVASGFVFSGGILTVSGVQVVDLLLTYFWFIGITNAVNMLDNMDGLAAGVVIVASIALVVLSLPSPGTETASILAVSLGVAFIGALMGFLLHNLPPASIFMGDSGSLTIGYVLAGLAVPSPLNGFMSIGGHSSVYGPLLVILIPATVLAIPIFDTTLVTITRKWSAKRMSEGGRDHSSHRLVGLGLSEWRTLTILYGMAAFGGSIAVLMQRLPGQSVPLFGAFVVVLVLSGVYLGQVKVQFLESTHIPPAWTPLVSNILYKRHAAEVLADTVLIVLCFYAAYLLRFEGVLPPEVAQAAISSLPVVLVVCLSAFFLAGIYRGQWRLVSVRDLPRYGAAVLGGTVTAFIIVQGAGRPNLGIAAGHSNSAFLIFITLLLLSVLATRLSFRILDSLLISKDRHRLDGAFQPILVYGAGKAGKLLYDEVMFNPAFKDFVIVGYVDDDPRIVGRKLCGVPIKTPGEWSRWAWREPPDIWVSSRLIPDDVAHELARQCGSRTAVRRLAVVLNLMSSPTTIDASPRVPDQAGSSARAR